MSEATAEQFVMPKHGEICWSELSTSNVEGCKQFYSEMFGWKYKGGDVPGMEYQEIMLDDGKQFGGMMQKAPELENVPSHWLSYVSVDDIDASMAKAVELGGSDRCSGDGYSGNRTIWRDHRSFWRCYCDDHFGRT